MRRRMMDAPQRALAFLTYQAQRVEREVYAVRYQDIQYQQLIPVDTTGPEWVAGVTYYSSDAVGRANWFHARSDDTPHAEVLREKFETGVAMAAMGYDYDLEELGFAMQMGLDIRADKANAARRAAEEFIDKVAILGDTTKNYTGVANAPGVTAGSAAATGAQNGATNSTLWVNKTPDQILTDVNGALTGMYTGTLGAEMADTLLIPYTQLMDISTRRLNDLSQTTIMEWLMANNIRTRMTGQPLTVRAVWGLETAGSGGTARLIAYARRPDVLALYMPMPFRFLPAWQQGPLLFEVPGIMRISGVECRRPKAMRYMDGI
jgi:hypothetical protein